MEVADKGRPGRIDGGPAKWWLDQAETVYQAVSAELQIELDALLEDMLNEINALGLGQGMQIFSERLGRRGKP